MLACLHARKCPHFTQGRGVWGAVVMVTAGWNVSQRVRLWVGLWQLWWVAINFKSPMGRRREVRGDRGEQLGRHGEVCVEGGKRG